MPTVRTAAIFWPDAATSRHGMATKLLVLQ